jgi:hypothetical protein
MVAVTVDTATQLLSRRSSNDPQTAGMLLAGLRRSLAREAVTDELYDDLEAVLGEHAHTGPHENTITAGRFRKATTTFVEIVPYLVQPYPVDEMRCLIYVSAEHPRPDAAPRPAAGQLKGRAAAAGQVRGTAMPGIGSQHGAAVARRRRTRAVASRLGGAERRRGPLDACRGTVRVQPGDVGDQPHCVMCHLGEKRFEGLDMADERKLLAVMQEAGVIWLQITGGCSRSRGVPRRSCRFSCGRRGPAVLP